MLRLLSTYHILAVFLLFLVGAVFLAWPVSESAREVTDPEGGVIVPTAGTVPDPDIEPEHYRPERTDFQLKYNDLALPHRVTSIFVMPSEEVPLEALFTGPADAFTFRADSGAVTRVDSARWHWTAPDAPGHYPLTIINRESGEVMRINAFVKTPFDPQEEIFNGYRIGRYRLDPYKNNPAYQPPEGLIEVTPENREVRVSPHFTLGQFLCKQESGWPKYVVLREELLLKLEMLLGEVNEEGISTSSFHVMSAYRTPWYNAAIGNTTSYSSHLYGGAADIFIDTNDDGYMDDLNGDGVVTVEDAELLADLVEDKTNEAWYRPFMGGLGIYQPDMPRRGPFIHVDVRGEKARW